jgi:pectate lyase
MTRLQRLWFLTGSALILGVAFAFVPAAPETPAADAPPAVRKLPAFPGAEGAGAYTPGGRGGKVYLVKNLNDKGPGSLREAVEARGPRMVLFRVAGIIHLETPLKISHPFITIAGQSAPGDGICIRNQTFEINTHDVVLRYLRFRRGNLKVRDDALGGHPVKNVIVDHVSASWGLDENLSLYRHMAKGPDGKDLKLPTENLTIQWCISSEALNRYNHAFGGIWGGKNCTFHHNLFACNTGRNPSIGMGGDFDFRNNVLFNWRHRTIDGGDGSSRVNIVANYFKPGPATSGALRYRICKIDGRSSRYEFPGFGKWYVADNYVDGNPKVTADNWAGGVQYAPARKDKQEIVPMGTEKDVRVRKPFPAAPIQQEKAGEAYAAVLANAGASLPRRDAVDLRIIRSVRTGKPTYKNGIIDAPADVGGWPEYKAGDGPDVDTDGDGIPDWWEKKYGLDPNDPSDGVKDLNGDGYTNLEKYLNGIDPTKKVDFTRPENNKNPFHKKS